MKILGYIHTFNDEDVIDRSVRALLNQQHAVDEILLVDNNSADGTLDGTFPPQVTIIRHPRNLGTSGAVATGLKYAQQHDYDWMWILDADSAPEDDALAKLVELHESLSPNAPERIGVLSCCHIIQPTARQRNDDTDQHQQVADRTPRLSCHRLTPRGPRIVNVDMDQPYYETDTTIWSGSLYNIAATREVGLPRHGLNGYWEDFNLDWGDGEYAYRIKRAGYRVLVHTSSIIYHPLGDEIQFRIFGKLIPSTNYPPFRRYLDYRNMVYFWLYLYPNKRLVSVTLFMLRRFFGTALKILLLERRPWIKIWACCRGAWDGFHKNLSQKYSFFPPDGEGKAAASKP